MNRYTDLLKIIRYAAKAPSGHNTQPWKFIVRESSVTLVPDFDRSLRVADPSYHELYISLGCALENFRIAAAAFGYSTEVISKGKGEQTFIEINPGRENTKLSNELFNCIEKRQVRRNLYDARPVPEETINLLQDVCQKEGIGAYFLTRPEEKKFLEPLVIEAVMHQTRNKEMKNELVQWICFSDKEAVKRGDGIPMPTLNLPNTGRLLGSFMFKYVINAASEIKRWKNIISNTPCFVVFTVDNPDHQACIHLGAVFQRFALKATQLGLSHAHANMPCQVDSIRQQMTDHLHLGNQMPLLLIRLGYSKPMPYSYRRPLNEIINQNLK